MRIFITNTWTGDCQYVWIYCDLRFLATESLYVIACWITSAILSSAQKIYNSKTIKDIVQYL